MPSTNDDPRDISFWDAFPRGVILPWYGTGDALPPEFKNKWAFCDGNNGTPNLADRFLMGVSNISQLGDINLKGEKTHRHVDIRHRTDSPAQDGAGFESEGDECALGYTEFVEHLPPYCEVRYIMKI